MISDTPPTQKSNLFPTASVLCGIIGFFLWGNEVATHHTRSVNAGAIGVVGIILGILGVRRARKLQWSRTRAIVGIVICALVALVGLEPLFTAIRQSESRAAMQKLVGTIAPPFSLKTIDGSSVTNASLAGTVYVLAFHSSTESLPKLETVYQSNQAGGLKAFTVVPEQDGQRADDLVRTKHFGMSVLVDKDSEALAAFRASGSDGIVLVGKDGKIVQWSFGNDPDENFNKAAEAALKMK